MVSSISWCIMNNIVNGFWTVQYFPVGRLHAMMMITVTTASPCNSVYVVDASSTCSALPAHPARNSHRSNYPSTWIRNPSHLPQILRHDHRSHYGHEFGAYINNGFSCGREPNKDPDLPFMSFCVAFVPFFLSDLAIVYAAFFNLFYCGPR